MQLNALMSYSMNLLLAPFIPILHQRLLEASEVYRHLAKGWCVDN